MRKRVRWEAGARPDPECRSGEGLLMAETGESSLASRRLAHWAKPINPDVIVMSSEGSQWLIDLAQRRFQRLGLDADPQHHLSSGAWTAFRDLAFVADNGALVFELASGTRFRTQIRSAASAERRDPPSGVRHRQDV
jgi:hypothetical protein